MKREDITDKGYLAYFDLENKPERFTYREFIRASARLFKGVMLGRDSNNNYYITIEFNKFMADNAELIFQEEMRKNVV